MFAGLKKGGTLLNKILDTDARPVTEQVKVANAQLDAINSGKNVETTTGPGMDPNARAYPEVPLPGGADQPSVRADQYTHNSNAVVNKVIQATIPTNTMANRLVAEWGTVMNESTMRELLDSQMRTGKNFMTGKMGPSQLDLYADNDRLTPQQKQVVHEGLYAANELDTREIKYQDAVKAAPVGTPVLWDDPAYRNNFTKMGNTKLEQMRDAMMNDPQTAQVAQQVWNTNTRIMQDAADAGMVTRQFAADAQKFRQHYMPTIDVKGKPENPFGERDISQPRTGYAADPPTNAMDAHFAHYSQAYKLIAENQTKRTFGRNLLTYQNADRVNNPQILTELAPNAGQGEKTFSFYDGGVKRTFRNNNTVLHDAINSNTKQFANYVDTANNMRRLFQSGVTGGLAAVSGRWFAPLQALRMNMQITAGRRPGTAGGYLDKVLQSIGLPGIRIPDIASQAIGLPYEMTSGGAAALSKSMSDMLVANNPVSMKLRQALGDQYVNNLAGWLRNRYDVSNLGQFRESAGAGFGGYGAVEPKTYQITRMSGNRVQVNPFADVFPSTFRDPMIHVPFTMKNIPLPGMRGAFAQTLAIKNLLTELHSAVHDSGNAYYYRLNKGNPNLSNIELGYMARQAVGDITQRGAGAVTQGIARTFPYANVRVQDAVRLATNFRDAPLATALGEILTPGKIILAGILTAMLGGKDHVDHLENQVSTQQREGNFIIYHDPTNPNNHTEISAPQRWRPYIPILQEMASTALGIFQMTPGSPEWDRVTNGLADFFHHHIQTSTATSVMHGLADQFGIDLPPPIQAVVGALGGAVREPVGQLIENIKRGDPWFSNMLSTYNDPSKVPGQLGGNTVLSNDDGKWIQTVLSGLFGIAGTSLAQQFNLTRERLRESDWDFPTAFTGALGDAMQNFRDKNPYGNILWGNNVALSTFNPLEEKVANELHILKQVGGPSDTSSFGAASASSPDRVVTMGNPKTPPDDPDMQRLWAILGNFKESMAPFEKTYNDTKTQYDLVNSQGLPAADKRKVLNGIAAERSEAAAKIDEQFHRMNDYVSRMYGRYIDIGAPIDWQGHIQQFSAFH